MSPLYEYRCPSCGNIEEVLQSFTAPKEGNCPICGGESHRIISKCSFEIPGFKNGEYLTIDDAGKS